MEDLRKDFLSYKTGARISIHKKLVEGILKDLREVFFLSKYPLKIGGSYSIEKKKKHVGGLVSTEDLWEIFYI